MQNNVLYTQNARGKFELLAVQALVQMMLDLSKFAQDMLLFVTSEYNFLRMSETLETGSSIMPQKRNPDLMELVRGRTHTVLALQQQIAGIIAGLPSGYNIDFQETKGPMIRAFDMVNDALAICALTIRKTTVNEAGDSRRLLAGTLRDRYGVRSRQSRGCHSATRIGRSRRSRTICRRCDPDAALRERTHLGASGNLGLDTSQAMDRRGARRSPQQRRDRICWRDHALVATAEQGI